MTYIKVKGEFHDALKNNFNNGNCNYDAHVQSTGPGGKSAAACRVPTTGQRSGLKDSPTTDDRRIGRPGTRQSANLSALVDGIPSPVPNRLCSGGADGCQGTWQRPTEWQDPVRSAGYQAGFDLACTHQPAPVTAKPAATAPQPAPSSAPQPGAPAEVPPTAAPPAPTGAVDQQTYPARPLTPHQRAFIEQLVPAAQAIGQAHDLYPSVLLAQAALESNFGTSDLAVNHHNYFGIKGQYRAQGVMLPTVEHLNGQDVTVLGTFRHYPDEQAALADYAQVLAQPTYAGVHRHVATTYRQATQALRGTYATDPNYDRKLNQLIDTYQLTQYDRVTPPAASATPPTHRARPTAPQTSPSPTVATALKANWTWPVLGGAGSVGIIEVLRRLWH